MVQSVNPGLAGPLATWERIATRLGTRLTTTPGKMRLAGVAVIVGLLSFAMVGTGAIRARQRATDAVGRRAEPLLAGAEVIYASLADADATATNIFLTSGLEPPERRQTYLSDLASAAKQLATVANQAGTSADAAHAFSVITTDLPIYSGLVEAARANNRQGLPVGAAYLREGSTLMQTKILPAVGQLYQVEVARLNRAYGSGTSVLDVVSVLVIAAIAIIGLIVSQIFLARRTNRVLNPALLVATILTIVLLSWTLVSFLASANRLRESRNKGSDAVQLLSSVRILISRAQADENLSLVARGSGSAYLADFDAVTKVLGPPDGVSPGLMTEAEQAVPDAGVPLAGLGAPYGAYLQAHNSVIQAETSGQFAHAVDLATGSASGDELPAAAELNAAVSEHLQRAQSFFDTKAAAGAHDLSGLSLGVIALLVVAAGSALVGFEQRINEYR